MFVKEKENLDYIHQLNHQHLINMPRLAKGANPIISYFHGLMVEIFKNSGNMKTQESELRSLFCGLSSKCLALLALSKLYILRTIAMVTLAPNISSTLGKVKALKIIVKES
jgi:hypothetical protein